MSRRARLGDGYYVLATPFDANGYFKDKSSKYQTYIFT